MTIVERERVMKAYLDAQWGGASNHEEAAQAAAQQLGVPTEAVDDVVFTPPPEDGGQG